jgi:hypothetical protein
MSDNEFFYTDRIHELLVRVSLLALEYRKEQGLSQKPGTQHSIQILLPEPNSHIHAQLTLTIESVPDFDSTAR